MRRDGERTVLVFVGGEAQKIEVNETPERIMDLHLGPALDAGIGVGRGTKKRGGAAAFLNSNCRTAYACGCGSSPVSGSGRGRGLPAGGTAEARGVVGSSTDSRFGFCPSRGR